MKKKKVLRAAKRLKKNCKKGRCEACIFYKDKCFLGAWLAPAFWLMDNLKEGKHNVR